MRINKLDEISGDEIIPGFIGKFIHGKEMSLAFWNVKKTQRFLSIIIIKNNVFM